MTYEELLQLSNVEVFITSDQKSFVFTIETYDEELEDISIKYYKITKDINGHPIIEKINNTIGLLLSSNLNVKQPELTLIKLEKTGTKDETKRNEFIELISSIEKGRAPKKNISNPPTYYTPLTKPELKLLKSK